MVCNKMLKGKSSVINVIVNQKRIKSMILVAVLCFIAVLFLFPFAYTIIYSFIKGKHTEIISGTAQFGIYQYKSILNVNSWFFSFLKNSLILTLPNVLCQTLIALPAAFAFSRLRSRFFDFVFFIYIITLMMPFIVTLVPNYIVISKLGLLTRYSSVILPGAFGAFGVFLLKQFMQHIPVEFFEAAETMGASQFVILARIVAPLMKNGIAALMILLFIDNWNMVEQPLIFLQDMEKFPLSIFLSNNEILVMDDVFAAAVLSMVPGVIMFFIGEKYLLQGISLSGISNK